MTDSAYSAKALKKSAIHFLMGKAGSAILTFCSLLLLVRILSAQDYGVYVLLLAFLELAIALCTLGLPWIAARYIPEYRLNAPGIKLYQFMRNLFLIMTSVLALASVSFYYLVDDYVSFADLKPYQPTMELYIVLFFLEGVSRRIREDLLGPLLMQGIAQISLVIKSSLFLLGLLYLSVTNVTLIEVIALEITASAIGLFVCFYGLVMGVLPLRHHKGIADWQAPKGLEMISLAKSMYVTQLIVLIYGPSLLLIMIQRIASLEMLAVLGFMRNLYSLIIRYLPAKLLFSIIRPKLVASYVDERGITALSQNANLVGKLSLFALMPVVVCIGISGEEIIDILSGEKFTATGYLFAVFMLSVIPLSQRQIIETVAVTTGNSNLCIVASLWGLIVIPINFLLMYLGFGVYVVPISMIIAAVIFNLIVMVGVVKKTGYQVDVDGFGKLLGVSILVFFLINIIPAQYVGMSGIISNFLIITISFFFLSFILGVFPKHELLRFRSAMRA